MSKMWLNFAVELEREGNSLFILNDIVMKRCEYTLYLGLNDRKTGLQKIGLIEAYKVVENIHRGMFECATIFEADCILECDDGSFTTEKKLRIVIPNTNREKIDELVNLLKRVFNQDSVLVYETCVNHISV